MQALTLVDGLINKINSVQQQQQYNNNYTSNITLGYWNIRGLADFLRLMLIYKNISYNEKMYQKDDEWQKDKYNLDLEFPNLPYLLDDKKNIKMTESYSIGIVYVFL